MPRLRVVGRRSPDRRCAYCHGTLRGEISTCPACASVEHVECRAELGRCPTLGCTGAEPTRHTPPPSKARLGPYAHLGVSGLVNLAMFVVALAALMWVAKDPRAAFAFLATRRHPDSPVFLLLLVGLALVWLVASGLWLAKLPSVVGRVRRLLDATDPVRMKITIRSEPERRSSSNTFAHLEGDGRSFSIALEGILPPKWLYRLTPGTPVYVYGKEPGPFLIELPDGRLAVIEP